MKRILSACLAALLLASGCAAIADAGFDFSGLTLEELYAVRAALEAQIEALEHQNEARFIDDGSYLVGRDLPEGDYALQERSDAVFASVVVRAEDSEDGMLILHKLVSGQADIHLKRDTWVTLSGLRAWPLGTEPNMIRDDGTVEEGSYLVSVQLPSGRYLARQADKAPLSSYSIYSDILGTGAMQTQFVVLHNEIELTLKEGDYIELSGCMLIPAEE